MTEQREPAIRRMPRELWWTILDEVMDQYNPLFFSTTFGGREWLRYSNWRLIGSKDLRHKHTETQRKTIGSVCRSWQAFAHSRRTHYVRFEVDKKGTLSPGIETALNARRVEVQSGVCRKLTKPPHLAPGFNWEIVEISLEDLTELHLIPFPRLRRLHINASYMTQDLDKNIFLYTLSKFTYITWLECGDFNLFGQLSAMDEKRHPVVLPNLQVLWYRALGPFKFPLEHLLLPSLQFMSLYMDFWPEQTSLTDILSRYRQTLRSFISGMTDSSRGPLSPLQFPPWDEYPRLEELVIDKQWTAHFHPLPANHPLQRLDAQHGSPDVIPSFLRGGNMKKIVLQRTHWTRMGDLVDKNGELVLDKVDVALLLEQAEDQGIVFKVA
ncbi:hypothetical protein CPB86DRAFT_784854 [Serendipita vermifera]|nr:hypothetical protein CPB86DRAFT_784854 [Serendipita vermifera]